MTTKINFHISVGAVKCVELNGKTVNSSLVTSDELQTHQGEVEPHPTARCPVSPETPPRPAQGSSEQELQHHTSSEEAERSLQEVVDALQEGIKQQSVRKIFPPTMISVLSGKSQYLAFGGQTITLNKSDLKSVFKHYIYLSSTQASYLICQDPRGWWAAVSLEAEHSH